MKQKKKGFTLVELVIVIAVIAILAGVMIAVFANVVNKANESAKLQNDKQAEIQQKLDDIEKKLENENWLGWEDFENELASQLAGVTKREDIENALNKAFEEYDKSHASQNTGLTVEQVKNIVENALSNQLTEAQVKTIVNGAMSSNLTSAQVSSIVNAAMKNTLSAAQVQSIVKAAVGESQSAIEANLKAAIETEIAKVNTLSKEEIEEILDQYFEIITVSSSSELMEAVQSKKYKSIKLDADAEFETSVKIEAGQTLSIQLNGHNLSVNGTAANAISNSGILTISGDGTVDALAHRSAALYNAPGGTVILNGGIYTRSGEKGSSDSDSGGNSFYVLQNQGTMTVNDGVTIKAEGAFSSLFANGWYDGSKNTTHTPAILTINGGVFVGGLNTIKNDDWGEMVIYGGDFTNSNQSVIFNVNVLAIHGGTFKQTGNATSVIYNRKIDDVMDKGELTITGGSFTGKVNRHSGNIVITGGTFDTDVSAFQK